MRRVGRPETFWPRYDGAQLEQTRHYECAPRSAAAAPRAQHGGRARGARRSFSPRLRDVVAGLVDLVRRVALLSRRREDLVVLLVDGVANCAASRTSSVLADGPRRVGKAPNSASSWACSRCNWFAGTWRAAAPARPRGFAAATASASARRRATTFAGRASLELRVLVRRVERRGRADRRADCGGADAAASAPSFKPRGPGTTPPAPCAPRPRLRPGVRSRDPVFHYQRRKVQALGIPARRPDARRRRLWQHPSWRSRRRAWRGARTASALSRAPTPCTRPRRAGAPAAVFAVLAAARA